MQKLRNRKAEKIVPIKKLPSMMKRFRISIKTVYRKRNEPATAQPPVVEANMENILNDKYFIVHYWLNELLSHFIVIT
jgi:hypothetical protein